MMRYKCLLLWIIAFVFLTLAKSQRTGDVCTNTQILCDDLECIDKDQWCDWEKDCGDGSDEKYCKKHGFININNNCIEGKHFTCDNGRCIPLGAWCDEFDDCGDFSDELETICNDTSTESSSKTAAETIYDSGNLHSNPNLNAHSKPTTGHELFTTASNTYSANSAIPDYYDKRKLESVDQDSRSFPNNNRNNIYPSNLDRPGVNRHATNRNQHYPGGYYVRNNSFNPTVPPQRRRERQNTKNKNRYNSRNNNNNQESTWNNGDFNRPREDDYKSIHYSLPSTQKSKIIPHRSPAVPRQQTQILYPDAVIYPPPLRQSYCSGRTVKNFSLPRFYFEKDYAYEYGSSYQFKVKKAKDWFLNQKDFSYTWGSNTPRILVALSLTENNFTTDIAQNELMIKGLQTHLAIALLRNKTNPMTISRLAMYINALHATCQNPRDFMDLNLVDILSQRLDAQESSEANPYVLLTMCLSDEWIERDIVMQFLRRNFVTQKIKDQHILATLALACISHRNPDDRDISALVASAVEALQRNQLHDGSFGDVYSTALAAQAFMSVNTTLPWDPRRMLNYISQYQKPDGSFGDLLSTYYSIIALSGRSLLHIRNTWCKKTVVNQAVLPVDVLNSNGPMKAFFLSVAVGFPNRTYYSIHLRVRREANLLDSLRAAECLDRRFKFQSEEFHGTTEVHTISNLTNDPERGSHWYLYEVEPTESLDLSQRQRIDIKRKIPENGHEYVFWYLNEFELEETIPGMEEDRVF